MKLKQAIEQQARELGFDLCRFTTVDPPATSAIFKRWIESGQHGQMQYLSRNADKRTNPQAVLAGARSIITLAVSYAGQESIPVKTPNILGGQIARYARYSDYHEVLGAKLKTLAAFVDNLPAPEAGTKSLWYVDTGPFLERDLAQRSGLGFAGKHTNLISRELGNWFFLAEIITSLEVPPDTPEKNRCGSCARCLSACPTGAITAPFVLDARRCISYLTIELKGSIPEELRPAIGNRIFGCDDCLAACPWNRFAREGQMMAQHQRTDLEQPDLLRLLSLSDTQFEALFARTPMMRTKRRGLLRNVAVALGNSGDERARPALEVAALDAEPLIAEHARWALARISGSVKH